MNKTLAKWRLLINALPFALIVVGIRYIVHHQLNVNVEVSFGDTSAVLTGAALILGLMLSGVIADYKESEKLPAAICGGLSGLDNLAVRGLQVKDQESDWARERIGKMGTAIDEWLHGKTDDATMWSAVGDTSQLIIDLEKAGVPTHYLARLFVAQSDLGGALSRTAVIRNTNFIKSGYALMEVLISTVIGLLIIVQFPTEGVGWLISGVLSLVYVFMFFLVKDLDNPFGYGDNNGAGSAADVDITPFKNALNGLAR